MGSTGAEADAVLGGDGALRCLFVWQPHGLLAVGMIGAVLQLATRKGVPYVPITRAEKHGCDGPWGRWGFSTGDQPRVPGVPPVSRSWDREDFWVCTRTPAPCRGVTTSQTYFIPVLLPHPSEQPSSHPRPQGQTVRHPLSGHT